MTSTTSVAGLLRPATRALNRGQSMSNAFGRHSSIALILRAERRSQPKFQLARWLVAACFLIAAGLGIFSLVVRPVNAWASVARALQAKPWIHMVTLGTDVPQGESWISPTFQILASKYDHGPEHRGAEFHDLKMGIKTQYVASEDTVYRLPEAVDLQQYHARELMAFEQILRGEAFQASPIPNTEIIGQKSREITEGGITWKEYELTIGWKERPDLPSRMWWRVNPATNLPQTWTSKPQAARSGGPSTTPGLVRPTSWRWGSQPRPRWWIASPITISREC